MTVATGTLVDLPDRIIAKVPDLNADLARMYARQATHWAKQFAPKVKGTMAGRLFPVSGTGWFGVGWGAKYTFFLERGIRPFTMRSLQGKTIPMWINDPTGQLHRENPKSPTRTTVDGRRQTLIFRKAARIGQRKLVKRTRNGRTESVDVPASYPGAPGRISKREMNQPWTMPGKVAGRIAIGNVGVRWRHPGLRPRGFILAGITRVVIANMIPIQGLEDMQHPVSKIRGI